MAYDESNFTAITYDDDFTLWYYKTPDSMAEVTTNTYFKSAATKLRTGDFLLIISTSESMMALVVVRNIGGSITTEAR